MWHHDANAELLKLEHWYDVCVQWIFICTGKKRR